MSKGRFIERTSYDVHKIFHGTAELQELEISLSTKSRNASTLTFPQATYFRVKSPSRL